MLKINSLQSLSLDIIRLGAAQLVLIGHLLSFFGIARMPYLQNMGVVIFFILSGLIISYTVMYKSQASYSFRQFFIERFARIYSGLVPSLVVILIFDFLLQFYNSTYYHYNQAFDLKTFIGNLFMLQDYQYIGHFFVNIIPNSFHITSFGSGRPLWTLAVEWWLYMSLGIFYFFVMKRFSKNYFIIWLIVSIVPLWNLIHGRGQGLTIVWIFGILITLLVFKKQIFSKVLATIFAFMLLLFAIIILLYKKEAYTIEFSFLLAGSMFFMLLAQQNSTLLYRGKFSKIVKFVAGYSFTLYLIHYTIIEFVISFKLDYNKYYMAVGCFVLANIIAAPIAYFTEMKHKKLAEKLNKRFGINNVKK